MLVAGDWGLGAGILFDTMERTMKCYRDLVVWQEGIDHIYALSKDFPAEEKFALCN
jgi:hypothetical protein